MTILALETSMGACSAALLTDGASPALLAEEQPMTQGHAEALLPMVDALMHQAGIGFDAIETIAATVGPGSFTGVRIAIAAARAFHLATGAKLWATDSLAVMAWRALGSGEMRANGDAPFAVAVDARRGMLYLGIYDGQGRTLRGPLLIGIEEASGLLPQDLQIAAGGGGPLLAALPSLERPLMAIMPELQPNAASLADMAAWANGASASSLRPLYLRPPDAKPQASAIARR